MNLPKGIRLRGNSYFWDLTVKGQRVTGTCTTLAEAQTAREQAKKGLRKGSAPEPWILDKAFDKAMDEWERKDSRSIRTIGINARDILQHFGPRTRVTEINRERIIGYVKTLESKGNSPATINRKLSVLSKMLETAVHEGILENVPKMPRMKEGKGRIRFITTDEERQLLELLNKWGKVDHADAVVVLLDTGMRTGELFKLEKQDVTFKRGKPVAVTLWITKNGNSRTQPLTTRAAEVIAKRCEGLKPADRIFPFDQWWLRATWDRARAALGLEDDEQFVPHVLRHTCASRLAQRGIPLPMIKEYLGHLSIQTTMRYAHLTTDSLKMAVNALEKGEDAA